MPNEAAGFETTPPHRYTQISLTSTAAGDFISRCPSLLCVCVCVCTCLRILCLKKNTTDAVCCLSTMLMSLFVSFDVELIVRTFFFYSVVLWMECALPAEAKIHVTTDIIVTSCRRGVVTFCEIPAGQQIARELR